MKERPILFSGPLVRAILDGRKTQTRRLMRVQPEVVKDWSRKGVDGLRWPWATYREGYFDGVPACGPLPPEMAKQCPYGAPGDRLWVREAWRTGSSLDSMSATAITEKCIDAGYRKPWTPMQFVADERERDGSLLRDFGGAWGRCRHARFMPRWASRLTLEVTGVRVERLQAITKSDAIAEGATSRPTRSGNGWSMDWSSVGTLSMWAAESCASGVRRRAPLTVQDVALGSPQTAFENAWNLMHGDGAWDANPWVWVVEFRRVEAVR